MLDVQVDRDIATDRDVANRAQDAVDAPAEIALLDQIGIFAEGKDTGPKAKELRTPDFAVAHHARFNCDGCGVRRRGVVELTAVHVHMISCLRVGRRVPINIVFVAVVVQDKGWAIMAAIDFRAFKVDETTWEINSLTLNAGVDRAAERPTPACRQLVRKSSLRRAPRRPIQ